MLKSLRGVAPSSLLRFDGAPFPPAHWPLADPRQPADGALNVASPPVKIIWEKKGPLQSRAVIGP